MNATAIRPQPQVLPEYTKLASGYVHLALDADGSDGYLLDLWGFKADATGEAEVCDATLAGTTISLCNLADFSRATLMRMTDWYIAKRDAERKDDIGQARIDRHEWERDYRIGQAA